VVVVVELRVIGKYLYKIRCKWRNKINNFITKISLEMRKGGEQFSL
jgi:hypothetical protein